MSNRIRKTEHAGAKNGGGYWGKRHEAKTLSKRIRRAESRRLERAGLPDEERRADVSEKEEER